MFVGTGTAWKLKRAVRLAFLDFTDPAERRRVLLRELALNGPAAPGLYRDVVPITRGSAGLELGGAGEVVDWVLRMAVLPDGAILRDWPPERFDPAFLDALGDAVAADHAGRSVGVPGDVLHNVRNNARAARDAGLDPADVRDWAAAAEAAAVAVAPLLADRARRGRVRRAHGDLHLGNLCLWQDRPVPFDALEFDEAMATIDLGYDLAFLLMDLDRRVGRGAANRVLNRYVARTGDAELVRLLPLFLSRRAAVRAHVTGDGSLLRAALDYLRPAPGPLVAIGGLPGTGKSTLARTIAPGLGGAPGALVLRNDEIRKRLAGVAPEQRLGMEHYTPDADRAVRAALLDAVRQAGEHATVVDATFVDPAARAAIAGTGRPVVGFWLEAPMEVLHRRVAARHGDASDATVQTLDRLAERDTGPIAWHRIPADGSALARCRVLLG